MNRIHFRAMTTSLPNTETAEDTAQEPALLIGSYSGLPLVRINYIPETITTGNELANTILSAMSNLIPELIHPECEFN